MQFEFDGKLHEVLAIKEVALCADTIQSSQVLELSGIGDKTVLEPGGVPVKLHLPAVGTNVQDHVCHPHFNCGTCGVSIPPFTCSFRLLEMREDSGIVTMDTLLVDDEFVRALSQLYVSDRPHNIRC